MLLIWSSDLTPLCSSPLLWCLGLPCWDCRPPSTSWEWGQPWESWTSESLLPTTLHLAGTWWAHCLVWWPSPLDSSFNWCAPSFPTKTCARGRGLCYLCLNNFPDSSVGTKSACNAGDPSSIPGWGRSAGEGIGYPLQYSWASPVAQPVKNLPAKWETWVQSLGWEDTLEKGKATHSSILAWRIPRTV